VFSDKHKAEIGEVLRGKMGIDPTTTTADSWKNLERSESLLLAKDEKLAGCIVSDNRLRVKPLPGHVLQIADNGWSLPDRVDIGVDLGAIIKSEIYHDSLLIVENLQTFNDIHMLDPVMMDRICDLFVCDPLVVYRGDPCGGAQVDTVHRLINATRLPVIAFVDFDPAGLVIASSLPRLNMVLAPQLQVLEKILKAHGITSRYIKQVAKMGQAMQRVQENVHTSPLWDIIHAVGKALPQEYFH